MAFKSLKFSTELLTISVCEVDEAATRFSQMRPEGGNNKCASSQITLSSLKVCSESVCVFWCARSPPGRSAGSQNNYSDL
jgi:hypothetical protein